MNADHHIEHEELTVEMPEEMVARIDELCRISAYDDRGELVADAVRTVSFDEE
jgi:metal-responsive CopG/Arc/MetJ family transcriptional regulator